MCTACIRIHNVEKPHVGADILAPGNPDILASAGGVVLFSGRKSGYGNTVIIGHADGSMTLYAHMTGAKMPDIGVEVQQGQVIGTLGASGAVTGAHLHYEQREGGVAVPPRIAGQLLTRNTALNNGHVTKAYADNTPAEKPQTPATQHANDKESKPKLTASVTASIGNIQRQIDAALAPKPASPTNDGRFQFSDVSDAVDHLQKSAHTAFGNARTAIGGFFSAASFRL